MTTNTNLFSSPLEQFQVVPIFSGYFKLVDISITNETIILLLVLFLGTFFFSAIVKESDKSFYMIPTRWQAALEMIHKMIASLIKENIKNPRGEAFFPLVFILFLFIMSLNLIGLVPYSFTLTSHLIITLSISLTVFIGINIICVQTHGMKFFSLFLPSGTSVLLAFLLVPIELISYIFKPISLSIRLFANMMAGHTLLKVIAGFACVLMSKSGILFILHYSALLILIPLFALELGVALIQSFVFSILVCIYINDALNLH